MYVKITNGVPEKYTLGLLRRDNPNVSFPKTIPEQTLLEYGVEPLNDTPQPSFNNVTQFLVEQLTESNGAWYRTWSIVDKSPEDVIPALTNRIASDRYEQESAGIVWTDAQENRWFIDTSVESQNRLSSAVVTIQTGMRTENSVWKCATLDGVITFRPTTNVELQEIASLVQTHVQKCFNAESTAYNKVIVGDFTATFENEFALL